MWGKILIYTLYRLKRDLQDVEKIFPNLQFDIITPSFLHVIFPEYSLKPFLARFSISIPRFYPHSPPEVKCESAFCPIPNMITSQGDVIHPELTTYWTAIKGLIEVINILERIRSQIIQTNIG